jgi:hypothetical protein
VKDGVRSSGAEQMRQGNNRTTDPGLSRRRKHRKWLEDAPKKLKRQHWGEARRVCEHVTQWRRSQGGGPGTGSVDSRKGKTPCLEPVSL